MSRAKIGLALVPAICGVFIAVAAHADPRAGRIVILCTGGYAVGLILLSIRQQTTPARQPAAPYRGETVNPLAQLAHTERSVAIARTSALEFEYRVQPRLRRTAAERLRLRHGVDWESDPVAARHLLGEPTWHLLTTHHDDRIARAPTTQAILAAIETLEEV